MTLSAFLTALISQLNRVVRWLVPYFLAKTLENMKNVQMVAKIQQNYAKLAARRRYYRDYILERLRRGDF